MKLIWNWHGKMELYDIAKDPYEEKDLADGNPELAATLHTKLKTWLGENVAGCYLPHPNPGFDPKAPGQPFPFVDLR
jgi:hypothetical protein